MSKYENGLMPWAMASPDGQDKLRSVYEIPADPSNVVMNAHGQAFELINGSLVGLTLIEVVDEFHNYRRKQ
jgi:hypothetical protein